MPQEQIKTRSPFELREQHFYSSGILSNPIVKALPDSPSDKDWSNNIDKIIADLGFNEALLFGGRDNSIEGYYSGKHPIKIIEQVGIHSSTSIRKSIAKNKPEQSLAPGIIWHIENRYPIVYSTIDVAIYKKRAYPPMPDSILMGKKGDKFHFIGGFVDSTDENLMEAAARELKEETGLVSNKLKYEFSQKIADPRYEKTKDSIMTHLFSLEVPIAQQLLDIDMIQDKEFKEFAWIPTRKSSFPLIAKYHLPLFIKFVEQFIRFDHEYMG